MLRHQKKEQLENGEQIFVDRKHEMYHAQNQVVVNLSPKDVVVHLYREVREKQ